MSITRFGFNNYIINAQLNAGSTALPVTGMQSQLGSPSIAWQTMSGITTSALGSWFQGNAGGANSSFDCFGLFRTNLSGSATMRCRVWSDSYVTLVYDSGTVATGVMPGIGQAVFILPTTAIGQYFQVDIDDPGNPDGFINVPLAYVGTLFNPNVGLQTNTQSQTMTGNASAVTKYGQVYIASYWQARQATPVLAYLSDAEMSVISSLETTCMNGTNILYIPDVTGYPSRDSIFGICSPGVRGYSFSSKNARSWTAQFQERL